MFHNEKYMNCSFIVHYRQSLFFRSPSSESARNTKMTTRMTEGAKQIEARSVSFFLPPSFLAPTWMIVEGYVISNVYISIIYSTRFVKENEILDFSIVSKRQHIQGKQSLP